MLLFKWFIIAFRVKKKKNWPDLSPCFSLWLRFQKFFIYHLTDCAPTTLGVFQDFECAQGFCACPPLFLRYSSPQNSHGWFHLISSWMRQIVSVFQKGLLFPFSESTSITVLSYQPVCFLYDTIQKLLSEIFLSVCSWTQPVSYHRMSATPKQRLRLVLCPVGLVHHKISTIFFFFK